MLQRVTQFPNRLYHFIWRNWDLVPVRRLASFLRCSAPDVRTLAEDLGLGAQPDYLRPFRSRLRSLTIRRNWHLLPLSQISELLGMSQPEIRAFMREDDFLNLKLPPKPRCAPLKYRAPRPSEQKAAARMVAPLGAIKISGKSEQSFAFLRALRNGQGDISPRPLPAKAQWALTPRIMHPFDTPHNLTAFNAENTPLPYLRIMKQFGVDALWFPLVLADFVRLREYPEFGGNRRALLPRLRGLIQRAHKAGIKIYLYLCEPRGQTERFFQRHPDLQGVRAKSDPTLFHICTSTSAGQNLVRESIADLCRSLPGLAGLIDISASEYPTHCWSHGYGLECPRCAGRRPVDVLSELLQLMLDGITAARANTELIAWNWGWQWVLKKRKRCNPDITLLDLAPDAREVVFEQLPDKVIPLLNFEYGITARCGGRVNRVWEYALSRPEQGPYTATQKRATEQLGIKTLARIQVSNSTEFLGAPYVSVLQLVADKLTAVRQAGYKGFMGAWIFGGYPSPNLLVARELSQRGPQSKTKILRQVAGLYYGEQNAPAVVRAWAAFSKAFRQYPFSIPLQYNSPLHIAPAVPWPLTPTGQQSRMYGPSDDPENYCSPYTPEAVARVFTEIAVGWEKGLRILRRVLPRVDHACRAKADRDYGVAETFWLCCRSLVNHVRFCKLRHEVRNHKATHNQLRLLIADELVIAERYYELLCADSRLAFEASMQYFILPNDVLEKILGLHQLSHELKNIRPESQYP